MSKFGDIVDALEAKLHGIGLKNIYRGAPQGGLPATPDAYPLVVLEVGTLPAKRETFGASGLQQQPYLITIRLVLGAPATQPKEVFNRFLEWPDKFRAALMGADPTMGGLVFDSAISQPNDNLRVYRNIGPSGIAPEVGWKFVAVVNTTPASVAS